MLYKFFVIYENCKNNNNLWFLMLVNCSTTQNSRSVFLLMKTAARVLSICLIITLPKTCRALLIMTRQSFVINLLNCLNNLVLLMMPGLFFSFFDRLFTLSITYIFTKWLISVNINSAPLWLICIKIELLTKV